MDDHEALDFSAVFCFACSSTQCLWVCRFCRVLLRFRVVCEVKDWSLLGDFGGFCWGFLLLLHQRKAMKSPSTRGVRRSVTTRSQKQHQSKSFPSKTESKTTGNIARTLQLVVFLDGFEMFRMKYNVTKKTSIKTHQ